jgi:hypothetical protein
MFNMRVMRTLSGRKINMGLIKKLVNSNHKMCIYTNKPFNHHQKKSFSEKTKTEENKDEGTHNEQAQGKICRII